MNELDVIAIANGADKSSHYHNYTEVYYRLFNVLRFNPINLLEIGVQFGASIKTWLQYFHRAQIYGLDINHEFHETLDRYHFTQGDQRSPEVLKQIVAKAGLFHVVIDDGCHEADAIKISFDTLWPSVVPGGLYCIEDTFTLFHPHWQKPNIDGPTFIRSFVDDVNWRGKHFYGMPDANKPYSLTLLEQTIQSVSYHKGLVVLTKKQ